MRHIWGFLFWFADGGWALKNIESVNARPMSDPNTLMLGATISMMAVNGTSPASPLLAQPTTSSMWSTLAKLVQSLAVFGPFSQTLNMSDLSPYIGGYMTLIEENVSNNTNRTSTLLNSAAPIRPTRTSILSEIQWLKTLTHNERVNGLIITCLEGQIITILVVICFILIFLIREWVVQQQPGINMGAGFNAEFAGADRAARVVNPIPENEPEAEEPDRVVEDAEAFQNMMERRAEDIAARPIARPRRRVVRFEDGNEEANDIANENLAAPGDNDLDTTTVEGQEDILLSAQAGEDRKLMEELRGNIDHIDVGEFVSLWRRAGGNPDEVLKIMEAEGLGDRLRYWKNAMNSLKQANSMSGGSPSRNESSSNPETSLKGINDAEEELVNTTSDLLDGLSHPPVLSNDGLQFGTTGPETSIEKGKNKAVVEEADFDNVSGPIHSAINEKLDHLQALEAKPAQRTPFFLPDGTELSEASQDNIASSIAPATPKSLLAPEAVARRPRAVSEGQPSREDAPINLGTNYWTFADLPEENRTPSEAPLTITEEDVDQSWKNEQDLRVQNAVNKARREKDIQETYNASTGNHQPSSSQSQQPHAHENSPVSPELKSEGVGLSGPLPNSTHAEHSESDYGSDTSSIVEHGPENNPFHPDGLLPEDVMIRPRQPIAPVRIEPEGLVDRVADWLWGDMDVGMNAVADDEHIVQDLAAEEPFVPVLAANQDPEERLIEHERNFGPIDNNRDREVVAAALAAGIDPNDPDALDDAEDFDGIMELVGMRGPLTGLVQNALFAAVLISLTVALGVWLPYNVGKLSLLLIANPIATIKFPLRLVFKAAAVVQDLTLVLLGAISFCAIKAFAMMNPFFSPTQTTGISGSGVGEIRFANESLRFASAAGERIIDGFINTLAEIPDSEIPAFSAASHEAFNHIKIVLSLILEFVGRIVFSSLIPQGGELHTEQPLVNYSNIWPALMNLGQLAIQWLTRLPALLAKSDTWVISLEAPVRAIPLDHALSYWAPWDRFWAILVGYVAFCFLGAAYIRKGSPFSSSDTGKEWEATIIDILNQAGGVMKVILIISIEMLVFPLYCGLLLDLALLPLFANATVLSRILFTMESPFTSMFVHWFVGTCYMFHFALFVSMCRKIMRRGVLCKLRLCFN
jgi:E3 ubiquitin-protein ligase MARCH6